MHILISILFLKKISEESVGSVSCYGWNIAAAARFSAKWGNV